jgi:hypothetical protein
MEDLLKTFWGMTATIIEGAAALLIAIGAAEAFLSYFLDKDIEKVSDSGKNPYQIRPGGISPLDSPDAPTP